MQEQLKQLQARERQRIESEEKEKILRELKRDIERLKREEQEWTRALSSRSSSPEPEPVIPQNHSTGFMQKFLDQQMLYLDQQNATDLPVFDGKNLEDFLILQEHYGQTKGSFSSVKNMSRLSKAIVDDARKLVKGALA
jgi:hypothetical protein